MAKSKSGFTIIELMVVIIVIAVLSVIVIVGYSASRKRAQLVGVQADVDTASKLIDSYKASERVYPGVINNCPTPSSANICVNTNQNTLLYSVMNSTGDNTYAIGSVRGSQGYFRSLAEITGVGGAQYVDVAPLINVLGLKTYQLTFNIKTNSASSATATVRFVTSPGSKYSGLNQTVAVSTTYATRTITFTATNGGAFTTATIEFVALTGPETLSIDNLSMQVN